MTSRTINITNCIYNRIYIFEYLRLTIFEISVFFRLNKIIFYFTCFFDKIIIMIIIYSFILIIIIRYYFIFRIIYILNIIIYNGIIFINTLKY